MILQIAKKEIIFAEICGKLGDFYKVPTQFCVYLFFTTPTASTVNYFDPFFTILQQTI